MGRAGGDCLVSQLRSIAVGFDGSDGANAALRWALALADRIDAEVIVVHAAGLVERARGGAVANLEPAVQRLTEEFGIDAGRVSWRREDGDPCSVLLRAAQPPLQANLVVVGSRGDGGHAGLLLGSTSHELAERAPVPVVIVPMASQ